eukprot:643036-Amphidinium_carterae.1
MVPGVSHPWHGQNDPPSLTIAMEAKWFGGLREEFDIASTSHRVPLISSHHWLRAWTRLDICKCTCPCIGLANASFEREGGMRSVHVLDHRLHVFAALGLVVQEAEWLLEVVAVPEKEFARSEVSGWHFLFTCTTNVSKVGRDGQST